MKNSKLIIAGLVGLTLGCSNPNKEYIDKIKQQVKEDALGVELNYKSQEFRWTDTLFVKEKLSEINQDFKERVNAILDLEYFTRDNYDRGNIFSKKYLTKDRVEQLRNWEKNNRGIPFNREYNDYYQFAFANRELSAWVSELCSQIEETDSLLNVYEYLEEGNLSLIENVLWYYNRMDVYHSNNNPNKIWSTVSTELGQLKENKAVIDSLSGVNPNQVIYYKALNTYKINNPMLNSAEQELKKYFLFDDKFNITGKEDFSK